jgi:hypothetical protein
MPARRTRLAASAMLAASIAWSACGGRVTVGMAPESDHSGTGGTASSEGEAGSADPRGFSEGGAGLVDSGRPFKGEAGAAGSAVPLSRPACPEQEPAAGTDCGLEGIECSYGSSVVWMCRHLATCWHYSWQVIRNPCPQPPEGFCPEAPPTDGQECTPDPAITPIEVARVLLWATCVYDGGVACECFSWCGDVASCPFRWECFGPPDDPDCPLVVPNLGQGCATEGTECNYGDPCKTGERVICRDGLWQRAGYPCPL